MHTSREPVFVEKSCSFELQTLAPVARVTCTPSPSPANDSMTHYVCLFVYIIMFFSTLVLIVSNFIGACAFVTCY